MKKFQIAVMLMVAMFITSCATTSYVQKPTTLEAKPGKALVYFYRESRMVGAAMSYSIFENNVKIGALRNGTFFTIDAEPGEHLYSAKTESSESISLDVKAGRTYYVKGSMSMGVVVARPELREVSESEAMIHIPKLKYTVYTAE